MDSLIPGVNGKVPAPYSGIVALESIDSAGGWIASPIDLVRIFTMLDGWGSPAILTPESIQQMVTAVFTIPGVGLDAGKSFYVGLGIGMDSTDPARHGSTMAARSARPPSRAGVRFNTAPRQTL